MLFYSIQNFVVWFLLVPEQKGGVPQVEKKEALGWGKSNKFPIKAHTDECKIRKWNKKGAIQRYKKEHFHSNILTQHWGDVVKIHQKKIHPRNTEKSFSYLRDTAKTFALDSFSWQSFSKILQQSYVSLAQDIIVQLNNKIHLNFPSLFPQRREKCYFIPVVPWSLLVVNSLVLRKPKRKSRRCKRSRRKIDLPPHRHFPTRICTRKKKKRKRKKLTDEKLYEILWFEKEQEVRENIHNLGKLFTSTSLNNLHLHHHIICP